MLLLVIRFVILGRLLSFKLVSALQSSFGPGACVSSPSQGRVSVNYYIVLPLNIWPLCVSVAHSSVENTGRPNRRMRRSHIIFLHASNTYARGAARMVFHSCRRCRKPDITTSCLRFL
ncbi:hypothetical protein FPV67DRAFT_1088371 [Lyophyllum atratum]|nr:hypothetical protein FPV67DRAFT_1088371 [Lyophyllum atratum]